MQVAMPSAPLARRRGGLRTHFLFVNPDCTYSVSSAVWPSAFLGLYLDVRYGGDVRLADRVGRPYRSCEVRRAATRTLRTSGPEQGINTLRFRPGLYAYRLEQNGKVWMGKWVKEAP